MSQLGKIEHLGTGHFRLSIPAGEAGTYRVSQIDDYYGQPRSRFRHRDELYLVIEARVSSANLPGTLGFGFWNDPFSAGLGIKGGGLHLPALPNAAWFFHASPPNYLAFQDDRPAQGFLAAVFSSPRIPALLLAPSLLGLPLLVVPAAARWLRRIAGRVVRYDAAALDCDPTAWHHYEINNGERAGEGIRFLVDGQLIFQTSLRPRLPLGLVIWIDNQYAAWGKDGRLASGTLENPEMWLEVKISDRGLRISD